MAFIDITTNNLSRTLDNSLTFADNYVYVPGTTKTGDWRKPYVFTSLQDFKDTCGIGSPEGSKTYEYVAGLLSAGLPVIFQRIVATNQLAQISSNTPTLGVTKASTIISHTNGDETIQDIKVTEKYGGTFGNNMSVSIKINTNAYYLLVYYDSTLLEKKKLINYTTSEPQETVSKKLIEALQKTQFDRIDITVLNDDSSKFVLSQITNQELSGGTDFNEALVGAEIPSLLTLISDKLLYQPMFVTSGGYTDADVSVNKPIADALEKFTKDRQDCRALIDLPIGTDSDEIQSLAANVSYTQSTNTEEIPSASMCAPWCYMQVGNEQLWMPASYVYLTVVGNSISNGGTVYTPKAGLINGTIHNIIKPEFEIGSTISSKWQEDGLVQVNPIMKLQGNTYVIGGNSTLLKIAEDENNAFSESSADLAVITIRRFVYNKGMEMQYQYNSTEAFENFSLATSNFLNTMKSQGSVMDYTIANISTNDEPRILKIKIDVSLTPTIKNIEIYLNISYGSVEINAGGEE